MRIFALLFAWLVVSLAVPFWASYQPNPLWLGLVKSPVYLIPWALITLVVIGAIVLAPEEV